MKKRLWIGVLLLFCAFVAPFVPVPHHQTVGNIASFDTILTTQKFNQIIPPLTRYCNPNFDSLASFYLDYSTGVVFYKRDTGWTRTVGGSGVSLTELNDSLDFYVPKWLAILSYLGKGDSNQYGAYYITKSYYEGHMYITDSSLFATLYRLDTTRKNLLSYIGTKISTETDPLSFHKIDSNTYANAITKSYYLSNLPTINGLLPSQTGKNGYVLSTNGTDPLWAVNTVIGSLTSSNSSIIIDPPSGTGSLVDIILNVGKGYKFTGVDTFTQTLKADITGNAGTSTQLLNSRNINGFSFNGTSNINLTFSSLLSIPTTLAGYGITDAQSNALANGKLWIGNGSGVSAAATPSGDWTISNTGVASLGTSGVTSGLYGSSTQTPVYTVDAKGRITSASNTTISGVSPGGSAGGDLTGTYPNPTLLRQLTPTSVKTTTYSASVNDFIPCDNTSGSFTITLPTTPLDKSIIGVKLIILSGTNTISISTGGSDVFNKAGGSTTLSLSVSNQSAILQYKASSGIWYVISTDVPTSAMILSGSSSGGDLAGTYPNPILTISGVTAATYGSATQTPVIIVDAKGRITSSSNTTITPAFSSITGTASATQGGTSFNTWTTGDMIYSSASNTLSKLSIGSAGQMLMVLGGIPVWTTMSGDWTTSSTGVATIKSSVSLSGNPTTTTQSASDNSTKIATTAYVDGSYTPLSTNNNQSGTSYTLLSSDKGKVVSFSSNSSITLTIPSGLGSTFYCTIQQNGSGVITPTASGSTLHIAHSYTKSNGQYTMFSIIFTNTTDTYDLQGDMN